LALNPRSEPAAPLTLRPFRWADADDVFRLERSALGLPHRDSPVALNAFRAGLRLPRADPEKNVLLAATGRSLVGSLRLDLEINIGRAVGVPGLARDAHAGTAGQMLIEGAAARADEAGAKVLHVPVDRHDGSVWRPVLEATGMQVTRRYVRLSRPAARPQASVVPDGFRVRAFRPGSDEGALTVLQNAAFTGSWGYSPNTVEEVAARLALPGQGAEGILFIVGESVPVAYCWVGQKQEDGSSVGIVHMTGVHPNHRHRGLGGAVLSLATSHLAAGGAPEVELEMDAANEAAARLYKGAGFNPVGEVLWYELQLAGRNRA